MVEGNIDDTGHLVLGYVKIHITTDSTTIACWNDAFGTPGRAEIATTEQWAGRSFGLTGGAGPNFNHAKIGVSLSADQHYAIFGDVNQQGSTSGPKCSSSQNGRGGLFYVVDDAELSATVEGLISGCTAPTGQPTKQP